VNGSVLGPRIIAILSLAVLPGCANSYRDPLSVNLPPSDLARLYVRATLAECRSALERAGRPMEMGHPAGIAFPDEADVPLCLAGLLTSGERYADALRDVKFDEHASRVERDIAEFCLRYASRPNQRFTIKFDGNAGGNGFCRVTPTPVGPIGTTRVGSAKPDLNGTVREVLSALTLDATIAGRYGWFLPSELLSEPWKGATPERRSARGVLDDWRPTIGSRSSRSAR
jgi:hypothetical protein